jgi:hypothetical protein
VSPPENLTVSIFETGGNYFDGRTDNGSTMNVFIRLNKLSAGAQAVIDAIEFAPEEKQREIAIKKLADQGPNARAVAQEIMGFQAELTPMDKVQIMPIVHVFHNLGNTFTRVADGWDDPK